MAAARMTPLEVPYVTVPSLEAAQRLIVSRGGAVTSETRTAPGVGSWSFIADTDGNEIVLWEDAQQASR